MNKKIYVWSAAAVICAAALFFYLRGSGDFNVYDEFGIARSRFSYVNWNASFAMFSAEVSEVLNSRTFRTKDGAIITLYGASNALRPEEARDFMKKEIEGKPVVIFVCGAPEDYSGIVRAIVFYAKGKRCLNKDMYDAGFFDVKIKNEYFFAEGWFDAETD
ncbi:MAG: hypothetical protein J7M11_03355 [Elusimicrobia bacterium]|nr:hypothetical protein [Elusimicrobiota bacterium]